MNTGWEPYHEFIRRKFISKVEERLIGFYIWGKTPSAEDRASIAQNVFSKLSEKDQEHCKDILSYYIPTNTLYTN